MEENSKDTPSKEDLEKRRNQLCFQAGQHQFTKAVIEAELLKWNQEILSINNQLAKIAKEEPLTGDHVSEVAADV